MDKESIESDKTLNAFHDKGTAAKKKLAEERHELGLLLAAMSEKPPLPGTKEHEAFLHRQQKIQTLKEQICKKHNELMDILKNEEKISREIQEKD